MLEKGLHCFSKYYHIYEFIGTKEKSWDEIKVYLVKTVGLKESTARAQMKVALARENEVVIGEDEFYRLNPKMIQILINYFYPLYPKMLRVLMQSKLEKIESDGREWEIKYLKMYYKKLEFEFGFHDMKAEYYANRYYGPDRYRLKEEHYSKAVHAHHELNELKERLEKERIKLDE